MEECRNAYRVSVGRLEGKRSLGRPSRRGVDNIIMDLKKVGCDARNGWTLLKIGANGGLI